MSRSATKKTSVGVRPTSVGFPSTRIQTPISPSEFDIWKLIKRCDVTNTYNLVLRYRREKTTPSISPRRAKTALLSRRRKRPESATDSEGEESVTTNTTETMENDQFFKEEFDFDAEEEPNEPIYPHLVRKPGTWNQEVYLKACRVYGAVPCSRFYKQLTTDRIVLKGQRLGPAGAKACCIALLESLKLHTLDLTDNDLGPRGAQYVAEMLRENNFVKHVCLADNKLGAEGVRYISDAVAHVDTVMSLDLSGSDLHEEDAEAVRTIIEDTQHLRHLNLSHNEFREQGGKIIGDALHWNDTLETLDLSWNHLRQKGATTVADAIAANAGLRAINLSWNGFYLGGCKSLAKALEKNTVLEELDICSNRVDEECLEKLLTSLRKNTTLKVLKIGQNPLSPACANTLLQFILDNPSSGITKLDLTDQVVEHSFFKILKEIKSTRSLDVTYGRVRDEDNEPVEREEKALLNFSPVLILTEFSKLMGYRLMDLFGALDRDGSKSLNHEELQSGLAMLNIPLSDTNIQILIQKLDKDKSGEIDFGELMAGQAKQRRIVREQISTGQTSVDAIRVRQALKHLLDKHMADNPTFKQNVENMKKELQAKGGDKKVKHEVLSKAIANRRSSVEIGKPKDETGSIQKNVTTNSKTYYNSI